MRTRLSTTSAILMSLTVLLLATPDAASADCGGDYVECLSRTGALGSSEALHEMECYGAYWDCLSREMRLF